MEKKGKGWGETIFIMGRIDTFITRVGGGGGEWGTEIII